MVQAAHFFTVHTQSPRHAILITLDGVRTEEIFGGLDRAVLASTEPGQARSRICLCTSNIGRRPPKNGAQR